MPSASIYAGILYKHKAYTYVLPDSPERKRDRKEFPVMAEKYKTEEALKNKT